MMERIFTLLNKISILWFFLEKIRFVIKSLFNRKVKKVESKSKYHQSIPNIVKNELRQKGINIENVNFGDELTINDLELFCNNVYSPKVERAKLHDYINNARAIAYTIKYAKPTNEDEKTKDIKKIKLHGLKQWYSYVNELLAEKQIIDLNTVDILNVGIGNGYASQDFLKNVRFTAVDISDEALSYAKKIFSSKTVLYKNAAEELQDIKTCSIDLYLSLRTYQSTLFDKRMALHEAYRVLKPGGFVFISIPIMFVKDNGEVLQGLIPPGSIEPEPTMKYAKIVVKRIESLLEILNFKNIKVDKRSPFEIFLVAER